MTESAPFLNNEHFSHEIVKSLNSTYMTDPRFVEDFKQERSANLSAFLKRLVNDDDFNRDNLNEAEKTGFRAKAQRLFDALLTTPSFSVLSQKREFESFLTFLFGLDGEGGLHCFQGLERPRHEEAKWRWMAWRAGYNLSHSQAHKLCGEARILALDHRQKVRELMEFMKMVWYLGDHDPTHGVFMSFLLSAMDAVAGLAPDNNGLPGDFPTSMWAEFAGAAGWVSKLSTSGVGVSDVADEVAGFLSVFPSNWTNEKTKLNIYFHFVYCLRCEGHKVLPSKAGFLRHAKPFFDGLTSAIPLPSELLDEEIRYFTSYRRSLEVRKGRARSLNRFDLHMRSQLRRSNNLSVPLEVFLGCLQASDMRSERTTNISACVDRWRSQMTANETRAASIKIASEESVLEGSTAERLEEGEGAEDERENPLAPYLQDSDVALDAYGLDVPHIGGTGGE